MSLSELSPEARAVLDRASLHPREEVGGAIASVAPVADVAHPEPGVCDQDLAAILDKLDALFARYVAFPSEEARWAVVAWAVHTWVVDAFDTSPRLAFLSVEKGSGKSRALEVLQLVCPNAELTLNISPAALFRMIDAGPLTLLMDEADTYLGTRVNQEQTADLRGLVNAGYRRGATVPRVNLKAKAGEQIQRFPAFAPVALAGIGDLPDTIIDRSVIVAMKRRAPTEVLSPFRQRRAEQETANLKDWLEAWADAAVDQLADLEPDLPDGIVDRAADVWEPLIIIGDRAGGAWSTKVRRSATTLNRARAARDVSLGIRLLTDVRHLFDEHQADRFTTDHLLELLVAIEEGPWGDLRGKPIDARGLARRLRPYDVRPGDHRFSDGTKKGYRREDFHDAFVRYLPTDPLRTHVPEEGQQGQQAQRDEVTCVLCGTTCRPILAHQDGWAHPSCIDSEAA